MSEKSCDSLEHLPSESTTDTESCEVKEREGGGAAWFTVLGSILVYYASFGVMNSFGFFQNYYKDEYLKDTPSSQIALIGTMQMALMNSLAAVSGALCDQYGVKYLYVGSGAGTTMALIVLSFLQPGQFWAVFMTQGLLMGLTIALGVQPALTVVGQHFKERQALAMGLVTTGSALGGIGFPLMFERMLPSIGFPNALRLAALKIGICYTIALLISTSKPSHVKGTRRSCGSLIDFGGFLDRRYSVLCIGTWFAILGIWIPSYYIKSYANAVYPSNHISKYFLCILNSCSILGAISGGLVGDRVGRLNLLWPMTMLSGYLSLFLWAYSNSLATLVLFVCVYGFCTSSVTALPPSVIGQITPDDRLGARIGAFYSIIAIASLVGTPIGGALITDAKTKEGYRWLIFFSGAAITTGSLLMFASRIMHNRDLRRKW
ncbi:MFS general substrate transporter [Plenodomus tracheiphilus IPT5]|uniref:MFS general substrate transporter n=1 Tax=Plenodomus tracheiphilus IPT5 TaxID=1408161 RepID=A0A6A7ARH6_9PLEO|nr:MFS general substrate transporter [Plenodomus tracheiphilus IPT5]